MPRIPIFRLGGTPDKSEAPKLAAATPSVSLEGISVGVDNLRHDVVLSPRFVELGRAEAARSTQGPSWMRDQAGRTAGLKSDSGGWKAALTELQVGSLNRAKKESRLSVDLLARLSVTKFFRTQMKQNFLQ